MKSILERARRGAWLLVAVLGACGTAPVLSPVPVEDRAPPAATDRLTEESPAAPADDGEPAPPAPAIERPAARWVPASWRELPGWEADRSAELWPALLRSCERPPPAWVALCAQARRETPAGDAEARAWLQQRLRPYRVESPDGHAEGLITGYFEPLVEASRLPRDAFRLPLHRVPSDLATRKPYWTRQQLDTLPAARAALRGREIAYLDDALDVLMLQVQGSGRLQLREADGSRKLLRVAYAGHNDQAYQSVGRWLVRQGELTLEQASWPAIRAWAQRNPGRVNELLWSNPRVVFFREESLPDPTLGPRGAQGVPLTPGRSIAVDKRSIPYGTPVWLDTTQPLSAAPLQRLVMAQDTGSAIVGAVRADYFWGWGTVDGVSAEQQAGRMKQALRMWVLWPKDGPPPTSD